MCKAQDPQQGDLIELKGEKSFRIEVPTLERGLGYIPGFRQV